MTTEEIILNYGVKVQSLETELNNWQKRCEQYEQAYDQLQRQVQELLRNRFGRKSERFIDPENNQLDLFQDNAVLFAQAEAAGITIEDEELAPAKALKKKTTAKKDLPRRIEVIHVSDKDKICACGACKTIIRYETKELLHYQPAIFEILEQRREVAACPKGCDGEIITAPAPLQVLPKIKATEELLAFLVVSKLDDRQPLYHLGKQLNERYGVDCSRQTMARWLVDLKVAMQPIYNLLKDQVIEYDIARN